MRQYISYSRKPMTQLAAKYCTIHSVTIKFPNWCYYSNITNAAYQEWTELVRENVYLYCDMTPESRNGGTGVRRPVLDNGSVIMFPL
jgi:hypothetical protein